MFSFTATQLKTRLDKALVEACPSFSRAKIQKDIEAGLVLVNGVVQVEPKFIVRTGDKLSYTPSVEKEAIPRDLPLKTLYNQNGLLILDKPAGLAVHPGAGFKGDSLSQALLFKYKNINLVGEEGRHGIVHRLDKDTSGVILVALTQEMYEYLKDAFAERKVKKEYIALVKGRVEKMRGLIDTPIGKSKSDFRKYSTKNIIEPKQSLTEYQVLEYLSAPSPKSSSAREEEGKQVDIWTLIRVKLHTGRTHQIRVHMDSIGHSLAGDSLYGNSRFQLEGLHRQFLHAQKIEVRLPDSSWISAESELPSDLRNVLEGLHSKTVNTL